MTKCPICGDSVPNIEKHLTKAFMKKKRKSQPKYKDKDGNWHLIVKE
jgi:hypothetical protein